MVEWIAAPVVLGGMFVLIGPFALTAVIVVAFAVLAALVALVGAVLAAPYLLVRSVHPRLAERRRRRRPTVPPAHLQQGAHHEPAAT